MAKGDVLVTVATGELSDFDAERSGLVPTHAYAVMEVLTVNEVLLFPSCISLPECCSSYINGMNHKN